MAGATLDLWLSSQQTSTATAS